MSLMIFIPRMSTPHERIAHPKVVQQRKRRVLYHCGRKRGYPTAANAQSDLRLLSDRSGDDSRLQVYHCGACKGYHVGHAPRERAI